ncbi:putative cyclic nucleotide-gated ion channel 13 isoform X2 [Arachis ipaensis]|uniref:Cyclic nucleotide-gated ion channel n=1 Tax=Arachis hypogaea TaxID=3818 RepID=A0A6B9VGM9_ARAHY|nr:putative cyclic nucleotide-gated ion channel 13 isoform X2 [Arachis ipaensis]XP_025677678.1 putative cyclic nucleotide-gated ion channel 13 isoform X1 [Arachis hypogaea]XP_025677679.1 putative cyclic nucleotide-gated ion channel 13 isoform X1 [Arachis hypogaea]QHN79652.1 Cyclic nucleotide-gated ion channel [Arachis hypogaea]
MSHRLLPDSLRQQIRQYEQYKWQETRGVDEDNLICNLPKDLRRDIKRHLCLALLMRVGGSSPSLGATIYASRFAANALRLLCHNHTRKTRMPERIPPMLLQKPAEPDFTDEEQAACSRCNVYHIFRGNKAYVPHRGGQKKVTLK